MGVLDDGTVTGVPEKAAGDMIKNFISVISNPVHFTPTAYLAPELLKYKGHTVISQMQYPLPDLLGPALIPELGPDVPAGPAGHIHLVLIRIAALGALPDELAVLFRNLDLAVPAADLAVDRKSVV